MRQNMVDSLCCLDRVVPEGMSQVSRRLEVGNHKRRTLNTRLSSGTSAGTFACPAGPYRNLQAKQVRKTNQTSILYPTKKRVRKSIFTFRTLNLANFFFEGFRSTLKPILGNPGLVTSYGTKCMVGLGTDVRLWSQFQIQINFPS